MSSNQQGEPVMLAGEPIGHGIPSGKEMDIKERDPYKMNQHLRLTFQDIIAEPDPSIFSFDGVWRISFKTFTGTKLWCYRILTLLCAIPVSFCCGLQFACLSFQYIWCWNPAFKAFSISMVFTRKLYTAVMNAYVLPFYSAMGYMFSRIRVTMAQGPPPHYVEEDV